MRAGTRCKSACKQHQGVPGSHQLSHDGRKYVVGRCIDAWWRSGPGWRLQRHPLDGRLCESRNGHNGVVGFVTKSNVHTWQPQCCRWCRGATSNPVIGLFCTTLEAVLAGAAVCLLYTTV